MRPGAADDATTLFTQERTLGLARQVVGAMTGLDAVISVSSSAGGNTEFAASEVQAASDRVNHNVTFTEDLDRKRVDNSTNVLDDAALAAAVAMAEALGRAETLVGPPPRPRDPLRAAPAVNPLLWAEASVALCAPDARLAAVMTALQSIGKAGLVGAGSVSTSPQTLGVLTKSGHFEYGRTSTCHYSVTARTKDNTGSGWAAWTGEDWSKADPRAVAARAVDLGQRSRNPVAVEPGRWAVVMTAEALGELVSMIGRTPFVLNGEAADRGGTPFSKPDGGNKIGMKVFDERVTLSADPMDAEGGFLPFAYFGRLVQYEAVTWVEKGVLRTLSYPTQAIAAEHGLEQVDNSGALRMSGGTTSIEEMIASTARGIYVTRFSDVSIVAPKTLYMTGVTRDGTFLIDKGKVTKPIKNMRFEDSPFFFLNNLEALGPAKRVAIGGVYVMPCAKVRDFAFTSLTDAV